MTLRGASPVDHAAPVTHISFTKPTPMPVGAGARLPTGPEVGNTLPSATVQGNFLKFPVVCDPRRKSRTAMKFGAIRQRWEWTASPFVPLSRISNQADGTI